MRKQCLDCVLKHLSTADVYDDEMRMGYPFYYAKIVGHLEHAAEEALEYSRALAMTIRQHRLNLQDNMNYKVPYEELEKFVMSIRDLENCPKLPESCLEGLEKSEDGYPVFDTDTRP